MDNSWVQSARAFARNAAKGAAALAGALLAALRLVALPFRLIVRFASILVAILFIPFVIVYFVTATKRDVAYRNLHPAEATCQAGLAVPWAVLAEINEAKVVAGGEDKDGWIDPSNSESDAIALHARDGWDTKFRCALQHHAIPAPQTGGLAYVPNPIDYHLAFLEFRENGAPYSLVHEKGDAYTADEILALPDVRPEAPPLPVSQLDVLLRHLQTQSNYVIVFVHGWRHDARIGDQNVADLRHYAAHVARFLQQRCAHGSREHCEMKVTAVYVGWRGARVDETAMRNALGWLGEKIADIAVIPTLFDRKPISEQIAPAALSALRAIDRALSPTDASGNGQNAGRVNRMIAFGHSLGGNLLATALEDDALKAVDAHREKTLVQPLLGDLAVLINPASEAAKWTSIQRAVWRRIPYHADPVTPFADVIRSHAFFPIEQRPVLVSVTSALGFPPGRLRDGDCVLLEAMGYTETLHDIANHTGQFARAGVYDWATRDVFPAFKGDLLPVSQAIDAWRADYEGRPIPATDCRPKDDTAVAWYRLPLSWAARGASAFLRTFPFQNHASETTHTIGHLDPARPGTNFFSNTITSAAPFGTTHTLFPARFGEIEQHNAYAAIPNAAMTACEASNHWLQRARLFKASENGTRWDAKNLGNHLDPAVTEGVPAARFVHGFPLGGTAATTRANDPFWNVRVANSLMSKHDGYRLSSFICAMNQLVMDDITRARAAIVDRISQPASPVRE